MLAKRIGMISLLVVIAMVMMNGCMPIQREATQPATLIRPATLSLPLGFRPEGITMGAGNEFFVGSLGTMAGEKDPIVGGTIYRGDLNSGKGAILIEPQPNQMAVGLHVDPRTGYLFVAGGMMGDVRVYDSGSGKLLADYKLSEQAGFINDLVVTEDAFYATDSFMLALYRVPLVTEGKLLEGATAETITLGGDYTVGPGEYPFQANGIVATPDGKWLIIVNSELGTLYRVEPTTGIATAIDLGGKDVAYGDGLVLDGQMLYVVQNYANQLSAIQLDADFAKGTVIGTATKDAFDFMIPTTAALSGDTLYVVNGRFEDSAPLTAGSPDIDYALLRIPVSELR